MSANRNLPKSTGEGRSPKSGQLQSQFLHNGAFAEHRVLAISLPLSPPSGNGNKVPISAVPSPMNLMESI